MNVFLHVILSFSLSYIIQNSYIIKPDNNSMGIYLITQLHNLIKN